MAEVQTAHGSRERTMSTISFTDEVDTLTREGSTNRQMRQRIAQLAARLMAEDGIEDVGTAKRKAARQVGAPDTRNLPDNAEVEAALRDHLQIYQADEHDERVEFLLREALEFMQFLERFRPHLVGSVIDGYAGRYAEVDLQLFADSPKDLELFLINRGADYRTRESRFWIGGEPRTVPVYEVDGRDSTARLAVFEPDDMRHQIRSTPDGRPMDRVGPDWVRDRIQR